MAEVSRRRTQEERRAESEQRLLTATAELIVESGFDNLSLVAIGRRAGCSHALVTHLFGTKATLIERLNDVVDDLYRRSIDPAVEGKDGMASVSAFIQTYLGLVTSADPIARVHVVLWAQAVAGAQELRDSRIEWDRHFRAGVAKLVAIASGRRRVDTACKAVAVSIVGLLRGVAMQHMLDPASVSLSAAVASVEDAATGLMASLDKR